VELLNDMALFVEVVKARSFRGAAASTGVPNSTLSRRISLLEKTIGLRLLHRTTRKLELTEAGQLYFERSRRIVEEARLAHEELGDMLAQPSGSLRVSLPVDFANTYLTPIIAEFARAYPRISFDLDLTPRRVDLVTEPYDLAIRLGEQEASHMIARPIAKLRPFIYAAPAYIEQHGEPKSVHDLNAHECLFMPEFAVWHLSDGKQTLPTPVSGRFRVNSVGMIRRLAALGMGVALISQEIVAEEIARGQLVRVLPKWEGVATAIYAVTETRLLPAKTQRFIEFLRKHLKDN
jgi:DNA-binding transcriptional LysR family regulator